ncbi:putative concanavalin A-like lectin/glucanase domain, Serine/threonine-protein kinase Plk3 [Heracleum sosnowskyi]|uniref:non-specific serine/threonine protein kinase n=1 Tax=Heracleum sosnowskyi TaxID=360622 RepID=A0AAD8MHJ5_9APIA|nr:putative concanavalin A-like lectin/glucanase domain, Serine/threonine-protein kinase Plk3 [Heracleum sosnowskyi]
MGKSQNKLIPILWLLCFIRCVYFISCTNSSCPIDFSYVNRLPWEISNCLDKPVRQEICCQTIRSLLGVGLAKYLNKTSMFYFPNSETATSCMSSFTNKLASMSVKISCNDDSYNQLVVNSTSNCGGITTLKEWKEKVGLTELDSACKGRLSTLSQCNACGEAGQRVAPRLESMRLNSTKCFYYTCLYAAGIVNEYGPENARIAECALGLDVAKSTTNKRKNVFKVVFGLLGAIFGVLITWGCFIIYQNLRKKRRLAALRQDYVRGVKAKVLPNTGAKWFHIAELDQATKGFSEKNMIGQGGFGVVYKGTVLDGTIVAVKQLLNMDVNGDDQEFTNEAEIISKIRHRNLLALRGFCVTSDAIRGNRRYLVYDFMSNGSLDEHLFNYGEGGFIARQALSWPLRKNIIIDVAKGLAYLHYGLKPAIYHRDIKTTNILLDSEMKATLADFGLAKQTIEGESHLTTKVAGTYGYLAPEYALYGQLTEKSDVYSFGIIILEIMSGRKVLDTFSTSSRLLITDWAWDLVKSGNVDNIFDDRMGENGSKEVMKRFVHVGILCAHVMVALRPTISEALKMLEGDIEVPMLPDRPLPLSHEALRYIPEFSMSTFGRSSLDRSGCTSSIDTSNSKSSN